MGNREIKERIIKIIDWSSRIIAVVLAIGLSHFLIGAMISLGDYPWEMNFRMVVIGSVIILIFCSSLQLGLFLAPTVREKEIAPRLVVAILMLPSASLLVYVATVTRDTIMFIVCCIGSIVYMIQYCLLFSSIVYYLKVNLKRAFFMRKL